MSATASVLFFLAGLLCGVLGVFGDVFLGWCIPDLDTDTVDSSN